MGRRKLFLAATLSLFLIIPPSEAKDRFWHKLKNLKWVDYAPTKFNPQKGVYPSSVSIKKDLEVLQKAGFNGIVTYGSERTLKHIPYLAKQVGFKGVIMGIWDINSLGEIKSALYAQKYVDGYCVGNEGYKYRYNFQQLNSTIRFIKCVTGKPTTTAEQIDNYYYDKNLVDISDWIFVNAHPYHQNIKKPKKAVRWVKEKVKRLERVLENKDCDKMIVVKELGLPAKGNEGCDEKIQGEFFTLMEKTNIPFVYFEAFDQPWKQHFSIEPHWGLFDCERQPKRYIRTK
ncbi:MAG: hypothetical protein JSW40_08105 [Candidatus Omnitrophota bacterium]|nr:MAG: hypothetical protein JSW40_08105 [Candidatus Omnitrophota bacterium]